MTDVSLKEHFERLVNEQEARNIERIKALQELTDAKLQALALAVEKQETAYNLRFANVNEWREAFEDVVNRAVSQDIFSASREDSDRRLSSLEQRLANIDGRIIGLGAIGALIVILSIVAQLLNLGG